MYASKKKIRKMKIVRGKPPHRFHYFTPKIFSKADLKLSRNYSEEDIKFIRDFYNFLVWGVREGSRAIFENVYFMGEGR